MAKRKKQVENTLVDIVEVRDSAKNFVERNQNLILGIVFGLVVLVGGYILYKNLYLAPKERNAAEQMFQAQFQFERDSFVRALTNPGGGYEGFLDIIDNYGGTKAANNARYYAAVSYLHLGEYEEAQYQLSKFKARGDLLPIMKAGLKGDIHSELEEFDQAIKGYRKAASYENNFLSPYYLNKLGLLYDEQGEQDKALKTFTTLKKQYPESPEAKEATKYIAALG